MSAQTATPQEQASEVDLPPGMRDESRRAIFNPVNKDTAKFTKYSAETDGEFTEVEVTLAPSGGNPLHYHSSFTETFLAVDNKLHIRHGPEGTPAVLEPGETRTIEIGEHHCFYNPTDEAVKFKVTLRPASEGFEKMLYIMYGLSRDGLVNEKGRARVEYMAISMMLGDTNVAGPGSSLIRLLAKGIAAYGSWRGMEEDLLQRYWK